MTMGRQCREIIQPPPFWILHCDSCSYWIQRHIEIYATETSGNQTVHSEQEISVLEAVVENQLYQRISFILLSFRKIPRLININKNQNKTIKIMVWVIYWQNPHKISSSVISWLAQTENKFRWASVDVWLFMLSGGFGMDFKNKVTSREEQSMEVNK